MGRSLKSETKSMSSSSKNQLLGCVFLLLLLLFCLFGFFDEDC